MAASTVVMEWLRQVPLFSACTNRELRAIAGVVKDVSHPKGTVIATEGDRGVMANLRRKATQADRMFSSLVAHMNDSLHLARENPYTEEARAPAWL